ncbi:MAG: alcohol dehydrogenase catalytic domain-containing protein [Acidobacteriota bacterium]|nr:alcohol dehydrogenase catalytic domain-containing protein [Acidobacteriota bacterium]
MNVAELSGLREFRIVDQPPPEPGPGELLVRVAAVGICGSDMHAFGEGRVGERQCHYPMVLGHEPSGVVERVGAGVTGWAPGHRGSLEPAIFCYHCHFCLAGRNNLCENLRFMSAESVPGFFRELVTLPAVNMLPIKAGTGLAEATLVEPLAVILHSLSIGEYQPGESAVVIGAGPIGLLTIAVLKLFGAPRVWAVEPLAHRREMARAMGADDVLEPSEAGTLKRVAEIAFDCAAQGETVNQSLAALKGFGRLVLTGIHADLRVNLDVHLMRRTELRLICVRRSSTEAHDARDLLEQHLSLFAPLITHKRKLEDINNAFRLNETYGDGVGKMLIV